MSSQRLSLTWRLVFAGQGIVLAILGLVSLIVVLAMGRGFALGAEADLLGIRLNPAHSVVLLAAGLVVLAAAFRHGTTLATAGLLCIGFVVLYLYGTAQSTTGKASTWLWLDPPENFLHAALALLNFVVLVGTAAVPWWRRRAQKFLGAHEQ